MNELVRIALDNMSDQELAQQLFEEIGTREEVIEYILRNCPKTVDFIYEQERDWLDARATDEALRYDFR